ncbi:MAG: rod shape-determining protein MreC [Pseudomonadota bacterium]
MFYYNSDRYSKFGNWIVDKVSPVMSLSVATVDLVNELEKNIESFINTNKENKQLKTRNDFLEYYFFQYKQLEEENKLLKEDLQYTKDIPGKFITAMIIGRTNNSSNQQVILNRGLMHGIEKRDIVVVKNQFFGRVIESGKNTSKVLLATDPNSRIPVVSIVSKNKFIASGNAANYFTCKFLKEGANLVEGELVETSGEVVSIPSKIVIGSIFKDGETYYIKPNIDFDKIEFVQILKIENE